MRDLKREMGGILPVNVTEFLAAAGVLAARHGWRLWLVGGMVRDLVLGRPSHDLDLVVEGDGPALAAMLAHSIGVPHTAHRRFGTATFWMKDWRVDVASARGESYRRPGALPVVRPGDIVTDLARRDITVNTLAISLTPDNFGRMLDEHGGLADMERRLIRVLHDGTFSDDATRIWRCLRYEQRLGFRLARATRQLISENLDKLDTISPDRLRRELELALAEQSPEKHLRRAAGLGVLGKMHPSLGADAWLARKFRVLRRRHPGEAPPQALYLALMVWRLDEREVGEVGTRLNLARSTLRIIRDAVSLREKENLLSAPELKASRIYRELHGMETSAIQAAILASASPLARRHMVLYQQKLRRIKPSLRGTELIGMGAARGPRVREILERLLDAWLDGDIRNRREEVALVEGWLQKDNV